MKANLAFCCAAALALSAAGGCACNEAKDTVSQFATINGLLRGRYDGVVSTGEVLRSGSLGIGTFDALDGEAIILEGAVWQAAADGNVTEMPADTRMPYASVVRFTPDLSWHITHPATQADLQTSIDERVPNKNLLAAFRIHGTFTRMRTRSIPRQHKPYQRLAEAAKEQVVFENHNVPGTLVGFRSPDYMGTLQVPGYHLHFLADDRKSGGHVLDFEMAGGSVEVDLCNKYFVVLPPDAADFLTGESNGREASELKRIEQ